MLLLIYLMNTKVQVTIRTSGVVAGGQSSPVTIFRGAKA